jgi:DNA topoisomerase-1
MKRQSGKTIKPLEAVPEHSAKRAGLKYQADSQPGYTRQRRGKGFSYFDSQGRAAGKAERDRIENLVIPSDWREVWISSDPKGHLQATGIDRRGRKQYLYHPQWRVIRDNLKFDRLLRFAEVLPGVRARVARDLKKPGLRREKVLACVVRLLELTHCRIGTREYAEENATYGLTTLRDRHVAVKGDLIQLRFTGKDNKPYEADISDPNIAHIVQECRDVPGYDLFQFRDENGEWQSVNAGYVNQYIAEITGGDFTAKDFRTWAGTMLMARYLIEQANDETGTTKRKRRIMTALKATASELNNTPTVCRKYYIHPGVVDAFGRGELHKKISRLSPCAAVQNLSHFERQVCALLQS